jgi:outer membrane lipoprotein LolB
VTLAWPGLARMRARARLGSGLALAMLLAACATRPPEVAEMPWTSGRLSIRVDALGDGPARNLSAAFDLRGSGQQGELRLSSPLGTLMAAASWAPGLARLRTSDGETVFGDLDTLAEQALGEALPLTALPDWLAGRPWQGAASQRTAEGFVQLGWRITLTRLAEGFVDVDRDRPPAVRLRARIER